MSDSITLYVGSYLSEIRDTFGRLVACINSADKAIKDFNFSGVRILVQFIDKDAVAVTAAGVGMLAFQCIRALLEIHLVVAVSAEQEAGEQINLLIFGRAVPRGDPLLRKVKGLLVNQRLMGIGEEASLIFRVYPRLSDL